MRGRWLLLLIVPGFFHCGPAHSQSLSRFTFQRGLMGTQFTLTMYAPDSVAALTARQAVYARMDTLNQVMSDYLDNSEINRLSATAGTGQWVPVSYPLFDVLRQSLPIARLSAGRFDPTLGPLSLLWRRAVRRGGFPKAVERRRARRAVGYQFVELDSAARSVQLTRPGMRLDLGGIGQGYAIDEAGKLLTKLGIQSALIDLGGDILATNAPPDDPAGWRIAARLSLKTDTILRLTNQAITTSGDQVRYLLYKGRRYSHIMNPHSGLGLRHSPQVTVLAPTGVQADALTKVFSLTTPRHGRQLVKRFPGVRVWRVSR